VAATGGDGTAATADHARLTQWPAESSSNSNSKLIGEGTTLSIGGRSDAIKRTPVRWMLLNYHKRAILQRDSPLPALKGSPSCATTFRNQLKLIKSNACPLLGFLAQ